MRYFENFEALAVHNASTDRVANDVPEPPPKPVPAAVAKEPRAPGVIGKTVAGAAKAAGAANDWMGRNVGLAVPTGRELGAAILDPKNQAKNIDFVARGAGSHALLGSGMGAATLGPKGILPGAKAGAVVGSLVGAGYAINSPIGE